MGELDYLVAGIRDIGWKPSKRLRNLVDHKIDFVDVQKVLDSFTFIRRSDRYGEIRYQIFGYLNGKETSVVCTIEGAKCHIISARPARRDERREFCVRL